MMKVHHLAALGAALFALAMSGTGHAQDTVRTTAGPTDHSQFVGDFAIGFLGFAGIRVAGVDIDTPINVSAPVIGGRYWLDAGMGIDAGIGFALGGASTTVDDGAGTTTTTDALQPAAIILHAGLPFALADSQYFVFELIPELNVGFGGDTVGDTQFRGFHLDVGARAGAEVHFGFIDIPQLSLQAGIGINFAYDRISITNTETDASTSQSSTAFVTTVRNDPWDIFTSNISALYYFDR